MDYCSVVDVCYLCLCRTRTSALSQFQICPLSSPCCRTLSGCRQFPPACRNMSSISFTAMESGKSHSSSFVCFPKSQMNNTDSVFEPNDSVTFNIYISSNIHWCGLLLQGSTCFAVRDAVLHTFVVLSGYLYWFKLIVLNYCCLPISSKQSGQSDSLKFTVYFLFFWHFLQTLEMVVWEDPY